LEFLMLPDILSVGTDNYYLHEMKIKSIVPGVIRQFTENGRDKFGEVNFLLLHEFIKVAW